MMWQDWMARRLGAAPRDVDIGPPVAPETRAAEPPAQPGPPSPGQSGAAPREPL